MRMNETMETIFLQFDKEMKLIPTIFGFIVLMAIIVFCIIGNSFIIVAIILERGLRNRPQSYLILSLAVADMLVGLAVTPLAAITTILDSWVFGAIGCDFWISVDVLACSSSIFHLVAIALDRYWSITNIAYAQSRTKSRVNLMLLVSWITALIISVLPILGWKDENFLYRIEHEQVCLISQDISFMVFSTGFAFYLPLCAIIVIYYKILRQAQHRFKLERVRKSVINNAPKSEQKLDRGKGLRCAETASSSTNAEETVETLNKPIERSHADGKSSIKSNRTALVETQRERKARRTLAIVTGTFIACWTPFFLVTVYRGLCECKIPTSIEIITNWLGYLNSTFNPIIYSVFSPDFRAAFKRLLKRILFVKC